MKRLALSCIFGFWLLQGAFAQTSTWIHNTNDGSYSWAMVRVGKGGKATVGDLNGVPIGDVTSDELIVLKGGKPYVITDHKVLADMDNALAALAPIREERLRVKNRSRDIKLNQKNIERERRSIERDRARLEQQRSRAKDEADRSQIEHQVAALNTKSAALERQLADASKRTDEANQAVAQVDARRDKVRAQVEKRVAAIIDGAFEKGLAKPK